MKYPENLQRIAGTAVPVLALKPDNKSYAGVFTDLIPFAEWCKTNGIRLIQILPVNDTGDDASPYSALSSLALHPIYLDLKQLPGIEKYEAEINTFAQQQKDKKRADYKAVHGFVQSMARRYFLEVFNQPEMRKEHETQFSGWKKENSWVEIYATFKTLKKRYAQKPWWEWETGTEAGSLPRLSADESSEKEFHEFLQYQLDRQFTQVTHTIGNMGVLLKGDIPILMGKDSADVWYHRKYFHLDRFAGAPPDMFSHEGQNWGFPVYNWEALKADNYGWWKQRIHSANKFYHSFRIDHVLGFFRLWEVREKEESGYLGYFYPQSLITRRELQENGFDDGRIVWLSNPHIAGHELRHELQDMAKPVAQKYLYRLDNQDLFRIKDEYCSEKAINALNEPDNVKTFLRKNHRQRALLEISRGQFCASWYYRDTDSFRSLNDDEKSRLNSIIHQHNLLSEHEWEQRASELLAMICGESSMRVCAEDLGVIFKGVERVLNKLHIAGLRIVRWFREYEKDKAPLVELAAYPTNVVATLSVHDTSTFRGWYEETEDKHEIHEFFGEKAEPHAHLSSEVAHHICRKLAQSPADLVIFALQDLFALDDNLTSKVSAVDERINVPGISDSFNWTYRMPVTIADLKGSYATLNQRIAEITANR